MGMRFTLRRGVGSSFADDAYEATGAVVLPTSKEVGGLCYLLYDYQGERANLLRQNLPIAQQGDTDAKKMVMLASTMAGMAFNRSGVHVDHCVAHALGAVCVTIPPVL